jgi:hypothetical protein
MRQSASRELGLLTVKPDAADREDNAKSREHGNGDKEQYG